MRIRTLLYYITIGFAAAVAALVGAQYIMRANIKELIRSNEDLLNEYKLGSGLPQNFTHGIDTTAQIALAEKIRSVDESGQRVLDWNLYVLVLVLIVLVALFVIIVVRMKKQAELITQLNISEKKLKEAVLVKENFLANMSHEIRTPLNAILGYTNLLQKKKLDDDTRLHISTVRQSGETLLSIVNDILDLSKIESGMMRIEKVPFNLKALVHSVTTMFHHRGEEKNIPLVVSYGPDIPEMLSGDSTRLTQILVNLIGNAFKFTDQGEIALKIDARAGEEGIVAMAFQVTDTGIGIDAAKLETIFERFRQAEDSTSRQYGGTGLGLSIVRDLVFLQGGDIDVKSKIGEGTTVSISIPYEVVDNVVSQESADGMMDAPISPAGLRVLIVEDHSINQGLMTHLMHERGIESRIAHSGREAIDILQKEAFDLVLMDIQMPEMDGYEAVREIRETLQLTVPIVAMTAHAMDGEKEKCLNLGMNDHISKPVREHELDRVLSNYSLNTNAGAQGSVLKHKNGFKVINLNYMKEISNGDTAYEKLVTEQFLHLMPRELEALSSAAAKYDPAEIRRIAHGMKTTISIMGLNRVLDESLDVLENENITAEVARGHMQHVLAVCKEALSEAGLLYRQF